MGQREIREQCLCDLEREGHARAQRGVASCVHAAARAVRGFANEYVPVSTFYKLYSSNYFILTQQQVLHMQHLFLISN